MEINKNFLTPSFFVGTLTIITTEMKSHHNDCYCGHCDQIYADCARIFSNSLKHHETIFVLTKNSDCIHSGIHNYYCLSCDKYFDNSELEYFVPTYNCKQDGCKEYWKCKNCGDIELTETVYSALIIVCEA